MYMIAITEQKKGNEISYRMSIKNGNMEKLVGTIHIRTAEVLIDNRMYYILYDENMDPDEELFEFVNKEMGNQSDNSKSKALHALKYLRSFEEIISKSIVEFTRFDADNLSSFLKGRSYKGEETAFYGLTERSPETVNGYLSLYRSYVKYKGIAEHPLLEQRFNNSRFNSKNSVIKQPYKVKQAIPVKESIPMYISLEQYISIINYVRQEGLLFAECIIRLMYDAGLRIGEVLGLTDEDLQETDEGFVLYIRNRTSDSLDQNAKTCIKVFSKDMYETEEYNTMFAGYQLAPISEELFELIDKYFDTERNGVIKKHPENYEKSAVADTVSGTGEKNSYIFLNRQGRPYSKATWNNLLREIFKACDISLDKGTRKHNLNHRFRHGAAMYRVQYLHMDILDLAVFLRHKSTSSVMKYYRPTVSDQIRIKERYEKALHKHIPAIDPYKDGEPNATKITAIYD